MSRTNRTPRGSQIKFNSKEDIYSTGTPQTLTGAASKTSDKNDSKSSLKDSKRNSKASVKESKTNAKNPSLLAPPDQQVVTSTPEGPTLGLDPSVSPIEPPKGSTLQPQTDQYVPLPYVFRAPSSPSKRELTRFAAKCPPYHIQLDHTLAVIWTLFSSSEVNKPLGIVQLQWALNFLNGIYNKKGEHPQDVALCIQAIEDELIEQYAEMVDDVQFIKKPTETVIDRPKSKSKDKEKDKGKSKSKKSSEAMGQMDTEKETPEKSEEIPAEKSDDAVKPEKSGGLCTPKRSGTKMRPPRGLHPGATASDSGYDVDGRDSTDACGDEACAADKEDDERDALMMRQVPFSINYAEMVSRCPPDVQQLFPSSVSSKSTCVQSAPKKSISGLEKAVSRDDMVEFLKAWRKEQVDKIQAELKRLKSIENFIGSAETENFQKYLDDKQLDSLVNRKISSSGRLDDKRTKNRDGKFCR